MRGKRTGERASILLSWLLIAVNSCLMMASKWRAVDKETMDLVKTWLNEKESTTDVAKLATSLGCSISRIYRMLNYSSTPLSLAEFSQVCELFGKNPDEEFSRILRLSNQMRKEESPKDLLIHRMEEVMNDYHRSIGKNKST